MAAKSLNKVQLIGNVTRDPELRYTPAGNAVVSVGLATNRSWKTDTGEIREEAEFHKLVAWNKLAEICSQLLTKGRKIYVEGRLQTRSYTGADNVQRFTTEIVIDDMILLDSKYASGGAGGGYAPSPTTAASTPTSVPAPAPTPGDDAATAAATVSAPGDTAKGEERKTKDKRQKIKDKVRDTEDKTDRTNAADTADTDDAGKPTEANMGGDMTGEEKVKVEDIPF